MAIQMHDIIQAMEALAPSRLAESWDNPGLACGRPGQAVTAVFLALTPTMDVLQRAKEAGCEAVITHHPLIFKPVKSLAETASPARELAFLVRHDMALFSAHTNLDICEGGVNDVLADLFNLEDREPLSVTERQAYYKLRVFVPESHLDSLKEALLAAGAGNQGDYDQCAWQVTGQGQFRPKERANPYLGEAGQVETVPEVVLELLLSSPALPAVLAAMHQAHPYEEVAYDLFRQEGRSEARGLGRIGRLPEPLALKDFKAIVSDRLKTPIQSSTDDDRLITTLALCGGSASGYIAEAKSKGADCYITGDLGYHDFQQAREADIALIDATHFASERPVLGAVKDHLDHIFAHRLNVVIDAGEKNMFM
ncbi:Nif3-like dinuclear metal center hexameric protein [Peptococcus simiae]|uniref:Nif3-like dinuclear metal center hexameric protein n=1 Tax=Peptococcus simiae TaxID=1643805 RepID=UPI00397F6459